MANHNFLGDLIHPSIFADIPETLHSEFLYQLDTKKYIYEAYLKQ